MTIDDNPARRMIKADFPPPYGEMIDILLDQFLPEWRRAANDYKEAFVELGLRGQYAEIHRKVYKLKSEIWDGDTLGREQVDQIALELIGNCLIVAWLYQQKGAEFVAG